MKLTYADALLHLPVDAMLQSYLTQQGMVFAPDFDWADDPGTRERLITEIQTCPDTAVRDKVVAGLNMGMQLAHPAGKQAMFQAVANDSAALVNLIACKGDEHRSFWLFINHPALFEHAAAMEFMDSHAQQAQQHDLGVKAKVRRDAPAMATFIEAIKAFYQKTFGCGDACVAHLLDRPKGTQLLSVHVKDLPVTLLEFEGNLLHHRVGSPNIHLTLEYLDTTGVIRTLIGGGTKFHEMLVKEFAQHLLGVDVSVQRIKPPTLDLATLKLGFQVPKAAADGFVALQVKSITLMNKDNNLKVVFTAMASSDHTCVTELIAQEFKTDNPLARQWLVTAATINLYYAPPVGKQRSPVVSVEVTRRGRLNLHKFDEKLRAQLEGYLVQVGILQEKQTLSAQADATLERPDLMDEREIEQNQ